MNTSDYDFSTLELNFVRMIAHMENIIKHPMQINKYTTF